MAVDYAQTGWPGDVGKYLKAANQCKDAATGTNSPRPNLSTAASALEDDIGDRLETNNRRDILSGTPQLFDQFRDTMVSMATSLSEYIVRRITHRETVIVELNLESSDVGTVLDALIRDMLDASKSVNRSAVTLGSITPNAGNVGNGRVLCTKRLDGVYSPGLGMPAHRDYAGVDSELADTNTLTIVVQRDSQTDGMIAGEEAVRVFGEVAPSSAFEWRTAGAGVGVTFLGAEARSRFRNGSFENFGNPTVNIPDNWTRTDGLAGTHIFQETATANVRRGDNSLRFLGDAAQDPIRIEQAVGEEDVRPRELVLIGMWIKASAVPGTGTFTAQFAGTGYTPTSETVEVQDAQISGTPTGGTYTISWAGPYGGTQTTAPIAFDATSATVQAALRLLTGLECVVVTTQAGAPPDVTHRITFHGVQGNISQITMDVSSLTGGTPVGTPSTATQGVEGERINIPAAAFPTTWAFVYAWVAMPATIPDDFEFEIKATGGLSAVSLYIDGAVFLEPARYNSLGFVVVAGGTEWVRDDRWTMAVTNDDAGVFQTHFRKGGVRGIKVQLPSSGSPTILDAWAT